MARLYIDQDALRIAPLLRADGHDVVTAYELGLHGAQDEEQLIVAVQRNRTLITPNRDDFQMLHRAWLLWFAAWPGAPAHPGILVIPQRAEPAHIVQQITQFLVASPPLPNELYSRSPQRGWAAYRWERPGGLNPLSS